MHEDQALNFARSYDPKKQGEAYTWVVSHARDRLDIYLRLTDTLDAKADTLIRYIGGLALVIMGALPLISKDLLQSFVLALPSFLSLGWAGFVTMSVVKPQGIPFFPGIQTAFEYADYFEDDAEARFFATSVPMEKDFITLLDDKERSIRRGYWWFWFALFWLLIPLLIPKLLH